MYGLDEGLWDTLKTGWTAAGDQCQAGRRPGTESTPQGSILGPVSFNIFIKDLDERWSVPSGSLLMTQNRGGLADAVEGCVAIQRNLKRLKKWADRKIMQLNKEECKILHMERDRTWQWILGATQLERSFVEKDLVPMDTKLKMTKYCQQSERQVLYSALMR